MTSAGSSFKNPTNPFKMSRNSSTVTSDLWVKLALVQDSIGSDPTISDVPLVSA